MSSKSGCISIYLSIYIIGHHHVKSSFGANNRDSLGKSQTPESYDEDEYSTSDEEDIGSDEEEDSYDLYPDDDDAISGSDTE